MKQIKTSTKLSKKQLIKISVIMHIEIVRGAIKQADELDKKLRELGLPLPSEL